VTGQRISLRPDRRGDPGAASAPLSSDAGMGEVAASAVDYDEVGSGPTVVLVPGSCSTGSAWRPVMAALNGRFRCVTTSLLGYGGTAERRTWYDPAINHEADALETVMRRAGGRVHLVGHSFGALVALALALRSEALPASLTLIEPPAIELLPACAEQRHYQAFRAMTDAYFADFAGGNAEAIAAMVDFYGGAGTFAAWPPRVRAYAVETTPVNIRDRASAYTFPLSAPRLAGLELPVLVIRGGASHPAMQRISALLSELIPRAALATVDGAAHFLIATHAGDVGRMIAAHVEAVEARCATAPS
jgi:pimeloyl-ACP methyl ester carboxylesterase